MTVLTTPYAGDTDFDRQQPFRVVRAPAPVLGPARAVARQIQRLVAETGARLVVLDPVLPLGLLGHRLGCPYAVVVHGAELSVPGRLPGGRALARRVLDSARLVVAAGKFAAAEARRVSAGVPTVVVPPGVDIERFRPFDGDRAAVRARYRLPEDGPLVVAVGRLVPRKGFDTLIAATALLAPTHAGMTVAVAGNGRDRDRLARLVAATGAPVRLVGRVGDAALPELIGAADVFAMPCRSRWSGLEQEGFGIVFMEAAACGVPQIAGDSGGAAEAVAHGETGFVLRRPDDPEAVAAALRLLLGDADLRRRMGEASRRRAVDEFSYDLLARRLAGALAPLE